MILTKVTISVHEKRNHPYEYGHKDAGVSITASLTDDFASEINALQIIAEARVNYILDGWIARIEKERHLENLRKSLMSAVYHLEMTSTPIEDAKRILRDGKDLPDKEYKTLREKVSRALNENREYWAKYRGEEIPF